MTDDEKIQQQGGGGVNSGSGYGQRVLGFLNGALGVYQDFRGQKLATAGDPEAQPPRPTFWTEKNMIIILAIAAALIMGYAIYKRSRA